MRLTVRRGWTVAAGLILILGGTALTAFGVTQVWTLPFEWIHYFLRFLFAASGKSPAGAGIDSLGPSPIGFVWFGGGIAILGGGWALLAQAIADKPTNTASPRDPDEGLELFSALGPRDPRRHP